jgi:hypothetical protein
MDHKIQLDIILTQAGKGKIMAGIVPSLFGPTPEDLMSLRRKEEAQYIREAGQTLGPRGATGAALGTLLGRGANKLFGLEDPEVKKATDVYAILKTTQQDLGSDATDPTKLYPALQENFANAGYGDIAEKVSTEGATKILDWNAKQATIKQKTFDLENDQNAKAAIVKLQENAAKENRTPTNEEIITAVSPFMSADKLAPLLQTSADKAAYRDTMKYEIDKRYEQKKQDAITRKEDKLFFVNLDFEHKKEIEQLKATLNPKGTASSVYERGYANQALNSFNELVPAFDNIGILTNKGVNPLTGGAFSALKGTGFMSATGVQLGQVITSADQAQYDSIMGPAAYNVAVLQAGGRVPRQAQIDNITNKILTKGSTVPHIAQLQKLGELRQIVDQANKTYQANPAASEEQKAMAQEATNRYKEAVPFDGTDVAKYSVYMKKNPTIKFQDWLKVNGSNKEAFRDNKAPQAALDMLAKDKTLAPAFQAKYGYLPEGN